MRSSDDSFEAQIEDFIAIAEECRRLAHEIVSTVGQIKVRPVTRCRLMKCAVWGLAPKACDTFDALTLLCRHGWGVEAQVLLRVLLEVASSTFLVVKHPDPWLYLYLEDTRRHAKQFMDLVQEARTQEEALGPDVEQREPRARHDYDEITDRLSEVLGEPCKSDRYAWWQSGRDCGERRYWHPNPIRERMRLAGMESWYNPLYRLTSGYIHPGGGNLGVYISTGDAGNQATYGPKRKYAPSALGYACLAFLIHLYAFDAVFGLQHESCVQRLRERVLTALSTL